MSSLPVTYRGAVNAWECDLMGHMNVQHYMGKSLEGLAQFRALLGLSPDRIRKDRVTLAPVSDRFHFRREMRAGDIMTMRSGVRGLDEDTIGTFTEVWHVDRGEAAALIERRLAAFDPVTRRRIALPPDLRAAAISLAGRHRDSLPPAPAPQGPALPAFDDPRCFETHRGSISQWETDEWGAASLRFHIDRFSAGMTQFTALLGLTADKRERLGWGLAALDYDLDYHAPLLVGTATRVLSGITEVRDKVFRIFHHLVDGEPARPVSSIGIVIAMFDLKARRAMRIPDEVRERARALLIPTVEG